jgi:hypothetical protein
VVYPCSFFVHAGSCPFVSFRRAIVPNRKNVPFQWDQQSILRLERSNIQTLKGHSNEGEIEKCI